MSVRVANRSLSKMEYVHNAQKIVFLVIERINKYVNKSGKDAKYKHFVKSAQYSIWNAPIYHANMVYKYCYIANTMRNTNKRLEYLKYASQNLELLETTTENFYRLFHKVVKDKFIELLTNKVDFQKKLINGAIKQSRNVS